MIAILVLLILIAAWLVPLFVANIRRADWIGEPRTAAQLRNSFYTALFLTVSWLAIYLIKRSRVGALDQVMLLLIAVGGIFATVWNFRRWRYRLKNPVQ